ncbi:hypothetical protein A2867_00760 [Candidatus Daviesbacteria bacterium RIFCSPHIGHO2_01_FULL_40_11]|uniref:Antitoxin n=1 Tax=Candidatus Daviesbacteria bacterium RIFCSPHIGHO2_01_FULL_40_11 TaxID=1797762 RepID=A0A1F5JLI6_9BACT|nr:MAG: hypothetical protein A2867_00760 [Candidatus Daviesbacteria bacterium RIFCSPHIGHO2_01_FULL_40_11]
MAKIVTNPKILLGKPTIEGTRIAVELILNLIEHGQTIPEIMDDYDLTEDQIKAAIKYARKSIQKEYPPQKAFAHEIFTRRKHR